MKFLEEPMAADHSSESPTGKAGNEAAAQRNAQHLAWLKAHREEYAGQYGALDGERLVGSGSTIHEAQEQARRQDVANPFLTHVSSEDETPFGGGRRRRSNCALNGTNADLSEWSLLEGPLTAMPMTKEVWVQPESHVGLHYLLPELTIKEVKSLVERRWARRRAMK